MFDSGVTVLFVSHSLEQVKRLCDKAMILDHGKLIAYGSIDEVAPKYQAMIDAYEAENPKTKSKKRKVKKVVFREEKEMAEKVSEETKA